MLNPNLASKISYERILNNFKNEAVKRSGVLEAATGLERLQANLLAFPLYNGLLPPARRPEL